MRPDAASTSLQTVVTCETIVLYLLHSYIIFYLDKRTFNIHKTPFTLTVNTAKQHKAPVVGAVGLDGLIATNTN